MNNRKSGSCLVNLIALFIGFMIVAICGVASIGMIISFGLVNVDYTESENTGVKTILNLNDHTLGRNVNPNPTKEENTIFSLNLEYSHSGELNISTDCKPTHSRNKAYTIGKYDPNYKQINVDNGWTSVPCDK